jgi:ribosomal protein S18 acetylase RimI-like enzyme
MTEKTADQIRIRRGAPQDAQIVAEFNIAMAGETEAKVLPPSVIGPGVRKALEDASRALYFIAECNGEVVGQTMVTTEWSDWRDGWFWWIQSVYVHPGHRGRGVFRTLYRHIESEARSRDDVIGLRLYVEHDNARAKATYQGLGMRKTAYELYEVDWSKVNS